MHFLNRRIARPVSTAATLLLLPLAALAEPPAAATTVPADSEYRSAFADYRPQPEIVQRSWREANDEMGRLGGHVGHVRNAAPPADVESSEPTK